MELALDAQDITVTTEEGLKIRETNKWQNLAAPDELEAVVKAEVEAQAPTLGLLNDMDAAGAGSNFNGDESGDESGREPENQPEGEGVVSDGI